MKAGYERQWNTSKSVVTYDTEAINQDIARYALNLLRQKKSNNHTLEKLESPSVEPGLFASLPCRFEHISCDVKSTEFGSRNIPIILDMAHNEGGMQSLVWKLHHYYPAKKFR